MRTKDHDNPLAVTIRKAFVASGMSIKRLATEAEIPYASAFNMIHKSTDPTLSTAARVCSVLGLALRPVRTKKTKLTKEAR